MPRKKKEVTCIVRVKLDDEELRKIDEACEYDERCRSDFVRIYAVRAAENLLSHRKTTETVDLMQGQAREMQEGFKGFMSTVHELERHPTRSKK